MSRLLPTLGRALRETGQALDRLGIALYGEAGGREVLSRHRAVANLYEKKPSLPASGFFAPSSTVVGDVTLGEHASVWYGAVIRGDVNSVRVGAFSNIQDGAIVHVAKQNVSGVARPTHIGAYCTVGHGAILHACTLEDSSFCGMGAIVMDGAVVKSGAMVAAARPPLALVSVNSLTRQRRARSLRRARSCPAARYSLARLQSCCVR